MDTARFKQQLLSIRQDLLASEQDRSEASQTVELDQSRVGRLSRMDAMQMQAMAKAEQVRAQIQLQRVAAALVRIERDEYGECLACAQPIAEARLNVDPAAPLCIRCASCEALDG